MTRSRGPLGAFATALLLVLGTAACGGDDQPVATDVPSSMPEADTAGGEPPVSTRPLVAEGALDDPPPVVVVAGDTRLELDVWTTCWSGGDGAGYCADGMPPAEPAVVTSDGPVFVEFPLAGWTFQATGRLDPAPNAVGQGSSDPSGSGPPRCDAGRSQTVDLTPVSATVHRLDPFGTPGTRTVDVFGRGPSGDVIVTFAWTTAVDGVAPVPTASLSLLADHDGEVDSYGVELPLTGLAAIPDDLAATVVVTAAGGESHELTLAAAPDDCRPEGDTFLTAPLAEGLAAAALGDPPFTYTVTVPIGGVDHVATAAWPDDVDPECAPCVPLAFDPPLPALPDPAGG